MLSEEQRRTRALEEKMRVLQGAQSSALLETQELRRQLDAERRLRAEIELEAKSAAEKADANLAHYVDLCHQYA